MPVQAAPESIVSPLAVFMSLHASSTFVPLTLPKLPVARKPKALITVAPQLSTGSSSGKAELEAPAPTPASMSAPSSTVTPPLVSTPSRTAGDHTAFSASAVHTLVPIRKPKPVAAPMTLQPHVQTPLQPHAQTPQPASMPVASSVPPAQSSAPSSQSQADITPHSTSTTALCDPMDAIRGVDPAAATAGDAMDGAALEVGSNPLSSPPRSQSSGGDRVALASPLAPLPTGRVPQSTNAPLKAPTTPVPTRPTASKVSPGPVGTKQASILAMFGGKAAAPKSSTPKSVISPS